MDRKGKEPKEHTTTCTAICYSVAPCYEPIYDDEAIIAVRNDDPR